MAKYLWFDLGYTLVYVKREEHHQRKLAQSGIHLPLEKIELAYHLADKYFMRAFPGLLGQAHATYAEKYYQTLHQFLGINEPIDYQTIAKPVDANEPKGKWLAFPETIQVLKQLKAAGYGIGLISNWNHTARDVLAETGIIEHLDQIVISSEEGIEKPDARIFEIALSRANVKGEDSIYIGDNYYDDVIGSAKLGMESILINPYGKKGIEELPADLQVIANVRDLPKQLNLAVLTN